jgi:hypothetical protein
MTSTKVLSRAVALVLAGVLQAAGLSGFTVQAQAQSAGAQRGAPQASRRAEPAAIRMPRGIYAVVVMDSTRAADLTALLNNSAVSGLAIRMFWSSLQPAQDRYDFRSLDAVFDSAAAVHKTIQLILVPGFGTPAWVLSELSTCDSLLSAPVDSGGGGKKGGGHAGKAAGHRTEKAASHRTEKAVPGHAGAASSGAPKCGKASFEVSEGAAHGQTQELPLPWDPVYKKHWKAFLTEVATRYGSREAFVSIAVAGPTAESVETILPREGNQLDRWGELLQLFYSDPKYQQSDQAFIDEWDAAATVYGEVFRNVTIVLTRGSGLLDFTHGQGKAAETTIVSSFAAHNLGANAKATQTSGMKACRETKEGIKGVKETSSDGAYTPPILGGAQFNTSFSQKPAAEGCPTSCDAESATCKIITPAQALSNVLSVYFDGTPDGGSYGASKGSTRMNYLQVYEKDIEFANGQPAVQAILAQASERILKQAR